MQRLIWPFIFSLILHVLIIFNLLDVSSPTPASKQLTLTVNITTNHRTPPDKAFPTRIREKSGKVNQRHIYEPDIAIAKSNVLNEPMAHLDTAHLLKQAGEYAKKEYRTTDTALHLYGDYSGTFSGGANGYFFFHLDPNGHLIGSGQSESGKLVFKLKGNIAANGSFRATGFNKYGSGDITGILDNMTGRISGSWTAQLLKGTFSAQHD
jgi:hypothetical protein